MRNTNTRIMLFYLAFMLAAKANGQKLSVQDSLHYAKELGLDFPAKIKFIENNSKTDYDQLVKDLYINATKYDGAYNSLQKMAKIVALEKTGDASLVDRWGSVCPDTVKQPCAITIDLESYDAINMLLKKASENDYARQANIQRIINFRFVEFLKNNPNKNPSVPEKTKYRFFGAKTR